MANLQQLLNLPPFSASDIGRNVKIIPKISDDQLQLATDMINVVEGRVSITSFPKEYQENILSFYRFSATSYVSSESKIAKRNPQTLDLV
jgi:hypothetical protein